MENGLLIGDNHGRLRPQDSITRAEMAAVLNRAFGTYKTTSIQRFRDVKTTDWFYKDLQMAYHMGTYEGTSASTMAPRRDISRQEAMTVVARALQAQPQPLPRHRSIRLLRQLRRLRLGAALCPRHSGCRVYPGSQRQAGAPGRHHPR